MLHKASQCACKLSRLIVYPVVPATRTRVSISVARVRDRASPRPAVTPMHVRMLQGDCVRQAFRPGRGEKNSYLIPGRKKREKKDVSLNKILNQCGFIYRMLNGGNKVCTRSFVYIDSTYGSTVVFLLRNATIDCRRGFFVHPIV